MPSLTDVYVTVRPETSRFGDELKRNIRKPLLDASRDAGRDAGRAAFDAFARGAAERAEKISAQIAKARDEEADAAGRVRVAEKRLAEARDSSKAKASQIVAAEEGLARARRQLTSATTRQSAAARALNREEENTAAKLRAMANETKGADSFFGRLESRVRSFGDGASGLNELATAGRQLSGALKLLTFPAAIGGAIALGGALTALASSAGLASTSLFAIAPAAVGAGAAFGTTVLTFLGASKALKAYVQQQKSAVTGTNMAANRETSAANAIRSAQRRLADARREQGRAAEQAADTVRRAEGNLADAQRDARRAQEDLNQARHEGFLELEEVFEKVRDLALDQEGAQIAVARAQERLNEVNKDATSTALDRREAAYDLKTAQQNVLNIEEDLGRATVERNRLQKTGIAGTEAYQSALEKQRDAQSKVVEAQQELGRAQKDAARIQADAARNVQEAAQQLTETQRQQTEKTQQASAAALTYADAMNKLTPEGRAFVRQLISMNPLLERLQGTAERRGLPGFTAALRDSVGLFPIVNRSVGVFAGHMSDTARALGNLTESSAFRGNVSTVLDSMGRAFATIGQAVVPLTRGFFTLSAATAPLVERFATFVTKQAVLLDQWLTAQARTGRLRTFFRDAADEMSKWGQIVVNFGAGLLGIFVTANKPGRDLADSLLSLSESFRRWVASAEGSDRLRSFFQFFADLDYRRIFDTAVAVGKMAGVYAALKGLGVLTKNPFFFLLQLAAVRDPELVSSMVDKLWNASKPLLTFLNDHPNVFTGFLVFLAGAKVTAGLAALGPLLGALAGGIRAVGAALIFAAANPIVLIIAGLVAVGAGMYALYQRSETFRKIVDGAFRAVGAAGKWLWENAIRPAFNGIRAALEVLWPIVRGIFQTWVAYMRNVVAPVFTWLWRNVIVPVFSNISTNISNIWNRGIKPVLTVVGTFIRDKVAPAFSAGVTAIGKAWDRLKAAATAPVNFVIGTVLNRGIFAAYNWVVGKFGGTKIPNLPLVGAAAATSAARQTRGRAFAKGTKLPGYGGGDIVHAMLEPGEAVVPKHLVSEMAPWAADKGIPGFATGGVVPRIPGRIGGTAFRVNHFLARMDDRRRDLYRRLYGLPSAPRGWAWAEDESLVRRSFYRRPAVPSHGGMIQAEDGSWVPRSFYGFSKGGLVPGFRDGGVVGAGLKEGLKTAVRGFSGADLDPAKYLKGKIAGALGRITGSPFAHTIAGIPRSIGGILLGKVKDLFVGALQGGIFGAGGRWPPRILGQLSANTAAAVQFVRQAFGIGNIGTLGNRPNVSDHPYGKALDAMIPNWQSPAGIALGNRIASWFIANPGRFGTKYVIWRDQINSGRGWEPYTHPLGPTTNPTLRHMDHVHVSLLDRGGVIPPGLNLVANGTGRGEIATPANTMDAVIGELRALRRDINGGVVKVDGRVLRREVAYQNIRNPGTW